MLLYIIMAIRNKKKISQVKRGTLDLAHLEKIKEFEEQRQILPQKKIKLEKLLAKIDALSASSSTAITKKKRLLEMQSSMHALEQEICDIESCKKSMDYITETSDLLINYYDLANSFDVANEQYVEESNAVGQSRNIISYFMEETENQKKKTEDSHNTPPSYARNTRAKIYAQWLNIVNGKPMETCRSKDNVCTEPNCGGEKILAHNEGMYVCDVCSASEIIPFVNEKYEHHETNKETQYAYKRINHLTEILSQLQAKESTDIPDYVFERIYEDIKKRQTDIDKLDIIKLRKILKRVDCGKFYEHIPHILQIVAGIAPPNFTREQENRIKSMFKGIQAPFQNHCPKDRKNFLNYYYVLHKFCQLLELDSYVDYFPLLKNIDKLIRHDRIWKEICHDMKWEFIKSI